MELNPLLFRPVAAGLWTHREAISGVFSFEDLLDAHELLDVREQNEVDFRRWQADHPEKP